MQRKQLSFIAENTGKCLLTPSECGEMQVARAAYLHIPSHQMSRACGKIILKEPWCVKIDKIIVDFLSNLM